MCLYKNAYQYTFANLFFIIKQMNTLSTINNPLGGTPWAAGAWEAEETRDGPAGHAARPGWRSVFGDLQVVCTAEVYSPSPFHKVPFKIMHFLS